MKYKYAFFKSLVFLLSVTSLFSCKKTDSEQHQMGKPVPTEHGLIDGPLVTKLIGAEGGSLVSGDGLMQLDIPEGAVAIPTNFSIQPVTKTLAAATGTAYRLGPGTVDFQKDVSVTFTYTSEDLVGTDENDLYLAYQDTEGYWYRAVQTTINKESKKLTTQTRHFSDWAIERLFFIDIKQLKATAGEEIDVCAKYSDALPDMHLYAIDSVVPDKNVETWFVNGPGSFSETGKARTKYKAPEVISMPQTAAVGVRIKNMVSRRHPDRPGNTGMVIVQVGVQLVPDEYFTWEFNGAKHVGVSLDAAMLGTNMMIGGTGLTGAVNISLNATKPGSYDMGSAVNPDVFGLQVYASGQTQVIYQGSYYVCGEAVPRFGKGKLTITKFGNIGGFVEGYFTATVYASASNCEHISRQVTGQFKIRRRA